jgi:hypothetical protein
MTDVPPIQLEPSHTTGRVENNGLAYEIQMARASDGVWHQRHIWLHIPSLGGELEKPSVEHWIPSSSQGPGSNFREIKEKTE